VAGLEEIELVREGGAGTLPDVPGKRGIIERGDPNRRDLLSLRRIPSFVSQKRPSPAVVDALKIGA
jgi:hypothetical protein